MSFTRQTAKKFRIPLSVVEAVTTNLLQLLRRHGQPADVQDLLLRWPEAADLIDDPFGEAASEPPGLLAQIGNYIFALPSSSRNAKSILLAAGLNEPELVPFVAAFIGQVRTHLDDTTLRRLLVRVPGLSRLCLWPPASAQA